MNFIAFINTIAALFIMLIIGFIAAKTGIIDSTASKNLSNLIIKIAQPALIISSLLKMPYSPENLKLGILSFLFGIVIHLFFAGVAYLACLRVKDSDRRKILELLMIFGNTGFLGIPLLSSLLGDVGGFMASFIVSSFNIVLWTLGIAIFARGRNDVRLTVKKAFINKGTVPSLIGFALFLLPAVFPEFTIPEFASSALSYIASLCTPVSLLIIGALLARGSLKRVFASAQIYYLCLFKLIVIPLAVCLITKLIGFNDTWIIFATAMAAMPCATTISMHAEVLNIVPEFSAEGVGASTLFSVATMPLVIWIAQQIILI